LAETAGAGIVTMARVTWPLRHVAHIILSRQPVVQSGGVGPGVTQILTQFLPGAIDRANDGDRHGT
jgi:hypothetical protein